MSSNMNLNMKLNFPPIDHSSWPQTEPLDVSQMSDFKYASLIYQQNPNSRCQLKWVQYLLDIPLVYSGLKSGDSLDLFDGLDTGSIHPLFRREAIINDFIPVGPYLDQWGEPVPDDVYNNAIPAFALATVWLHINMGFFWTILRGKCYMREGDENAYIFPKTTPLSSAEQEDFEIEMNKLAQLTAICSKDSDVTHGETSPFVARWLPVGDNVVFRFSFIQGLWIEIAKPDFQDRPLVERCNIWVLIATILMHEFSHCIWMYRHRQELLDDWCLNKLLTDTPEEPIMPYYKDPELGIAFEVFRLGGTLWARKEELELDADNMNWDFKYDGKYLPEIVSYADTGVKVIQRISPNSLIRLMRKSTWTGNQPVPIYVLYLQRIRILSFNPVLHDSQKPNIVIDGDNVDIIDDMEISENISISDDSPLTCSSHDDCESESDPEWDPNNPDKFRDQYFADRTYSTIPAPPALHSPSSSSSSSLFPTTASENAEIKRQREARGRTVTRRERQANSDSDSNSDRDSDTHVADVTHQLTSTLSTYFDYFEREQHAPRNWEDGTLTMPEDNSFLRLEPPTLSEDLVTVGMQGCTTAPRRSQLIEDYVAGRPLRVGVRAGAGAGGDVSALFDSGIFTEEELRTFDTRFPTPSDNAVDMWLSRIRSPSPHSQGLTNDNADDQKDEIAVEDQDEDEDQHEYEDEDDEDPEDVVMQVVRDVVMGGTEEW